MVQTHAAELSAIFEAITDGVLVCDASAEIRYINAAFRSMLALEEDADPSVLRFDQRFEWLALRDLEGRPLPREAFATVRLLRGERLAGIHATDFLCRTRKGEDIIVNVSGAPICETSGQITGAVIVLRDVTGRRSQERQLQYSERKAAERRKEEFLSMMSHELRSPLTAILGSIEAALLHMEVLRNALAPAAKGLLTQIEHLLTLASGQVEVETRLVDELLDVSWVETPVFEVSVQRENLVTIVRETVESWQHAAPLRTIELVLPIEEQVPVLVDAGRIVQVLINYLTNALKYAPGEQPIAVCLAVEASVARVSVRDQGPGLTPDQQQRVWERFYQASARGRWGSKGGLGLGLAIVKAIVEKHHGHVGVESAPGQGATFWFTVPLANEPIPAQV